MKKKQLDFEKDVGADDIDLWEKLEKIVNSEVPQNNEEIDPRECWQCCPSDFPLKQSEQVSMFSRLPNGLTPYELMYGQIDEDDILQTYINMS